MCFDGSAIRLRFSNLTGTEPVTLSRVTILQESGEKFTNVTFAGSASVSIPEGKEVESDNMNIDITRGETIHVSIYLGEFTQMNAGTLITGPLSRGEFATGDKCESLKFPADQSRPTNWFYFLNTVDVLTSRENYAIICYGDSITAQSWPDYLTMRCEREGYTRCSIIRRAVSGSRILRQYDCLPYQAYGLKGETRFPIETNVAGARHIIIQHGINDMIHPVGVEVNPFRPWSDMPTLKQLQEGMRKFYFEHAGRIGLRVWTGTLLPIRGWRTYNAKRDELRMAFNDWMRDGLYPCIDFEAAVRNPEDVTSMLPVFDSGDHLHPSEAGYRAMADQVPTELLND